MTYKILTDRQMAVFRKVAQLGMIDDVIIKRRTFGEDVLGDDSTTWPVHSTCKGWLYHPKPEPVGALDAGQVVIASTYRLWVSVDVDLQMGDELVIKGETFRAEDIVHENTFDAFHYASLRKLD